MQYRRLGSSGCKVSAVSLGSWLTYGESVHQDATNACVHAALDHGINLFDSADIYSGGAAERALARALDGVRRESYVLATKVFWPVAHGPNDRGLSRKHVIEGCHAALKRLQTDYIDLFQCHRFDVETPVDETVRAMEDLIRQGKILYWGTSLWSASQITWACSEADRRSAYRPVSNQPEYNLLEWSIEHEVIPTSHALGLGQIVYCPLAQGILTGKYKKGKIPSGSRADTEAGAQFVKPRLNDHNLAIADRVADLARKIDLTPAQLALAWVLRRCEVSSAIIGATRPEQVIEDVKAAEVVLDAGVVEQLEKWKTGQGL